MAPKKRPSRVRPKSPARVRTKKRQRRERAHGNHDLLGLGLLAVGPLPRGRHLARGQRRHRRDDDRRLARRALRDGADRRPHRLPRARRAHDRPCVARGREAVPHRSRPRLRRRAHAPRRGAGRRLRQRLGRRSSAAWSAGRGRSSSASSSSGAARSCSPAPPSARSCAARPTSPATPPAPRSARSRPSASRPGTTCPGARPSTRSRTAMPAREPPVDGEAAYPDVVGDAPPLQPVLVDQLDPRRGERPRARARDRRRAGAADPLRLAQQRAAPRLPASRTPTSCAARGRTRASPARPPSAPPRRSCRRSATSGSTRPSSARSSGPRVTRYELQLAPGTKVGKVAGAQGRPRLRARHDRDPHPRADPRQAGRRRRGAQPLAEHRHARRHLRRAARRRRARSPSGSARTSPARPSTPTSPACRTSSSPARPARGSRAASTRCSARSSCARRRTTCA